MAFTLRHGLKAATKLGLAHKIPWSKVTQIVTQIFYLTQSKSEYIIFYRKGKTDVKSMKIHYDDVEFRRVYETETLGLTLLDKLNC